MDDRNLSIEAAEQFKTFWERNGYYYFGDYAKELNYQIVVGLIWLEAFGRGYDLKNEELNEIIGKN